MDSKPVLYGSILAAKERCNSVRELKAGRLHQHDNSDRPPDYSQTDNYLGLVMFIFQTRKCEMDKHTDATKHIISLFS